jgi:hypothetical protein
VDMRRGWNIAKGACTVGRSGGVEFLDG